MTEFTPSFSNFNGLDYREFVILRYHNISKRKICKMYNIAYFRILEVCEMMRKNDFRFTYKDYKFLKKYGVSNSFICKMYHISIEDLEFFEVMNR
ncbi:hypothetical protein TP70_03520 [Staphylococcus microti]|uniref:Transposon-related protein n=2 Tax=Staphylococcus TaxID=1279 RepID=A0A0D6XS09_9STAP|nr:hypothetical protein [Staphylococcus microti]KIX91240.1 hypothetical protein TP70_03520 [Staphylococcus microti]PNZ75771.1 hypothetical protein CD132_12050 [Staphylococcus microti]SUM58283.1 transposon-related protein [Staphylococcus microti]